MTINNEVMLCPRCKVFITATQNLCRCGYDPVDENGMVKEE